MLSIVLLSTMLTGMLPAVASAADDSLSTDYDWKGQWIWTNDALPSKEVEGQWVDLRKTFTLDSIPELAEARISVDSRYWMWINGELAVYEGQLKSGPDKHSWYYDTVDLTPYLKEGENTIAVLACYWGFTSASAVPTGMQGFLFDAEFSAGALSGGATRIISDTSWKVQKDTGFEKPPERGNKRPDGVDTKFNAATATDGWEQPEFDDSSWKTATKKTLKGTDPRNKLVARAIPQWKVEDIVTYDEEYWTVSEVEKTFERLSLPESYTLTAEVKSLSGHVGIAVCMSDNGNFYMPQLQGFADKLLKVKNHTKKAGSFMSDAPVGGVSISSSDEKVTIKVVVDGTSVTTYVNDTLLSTYTNTSLTRAGNSVGFRSSSSESTAVYSMKITDTNGNTVWEDGISELCAGDSIEDFTNLTGTAVLETDANGDTYMKVKNCTVMAGKYTVDEEALVTYSFYNKNPETGRDMNMQGVPYVKVRSEKGGEVIKLHSDSTSHVPPQTANSGESVLHYYVTKAGEQEYEPYGWMSAWRVDFTMPASVEVIELGWRQSSYNTEHTGTMETSNEALNQLYREAYDTLLITMRDTYMDCPDRERTQWWGDAVLEMQQAAYSMDEDAKLLYKKLLTQVVGWAEGRGGSLPTTPTDDINSSYNELHAQCVAGVHSLWQYYLYYGETDILEYCYEPFMDYLRLWEISDTGYLTHRAGSSDWIDWGDNVDASVSDHTWYYAAAMGMLNVARVLGKSETDVSFLEERTSLIRENFVSMFWNEEMGAYYSNTANGKPDDRAQAMAVYSGLADPAHYPQLLEVIKTTENSSPYLEKYVLEALYIMGYSEVAIERTLKRYNLMIVDDFPTLYEGFDSAGLSGNGSGTATRNHAWSGGPLSLMYMYNAGILSTGAGFSSFTVRPHLGSLTYINASTDTVSGRISVNATNSSLTVGVPTGTTGLICVPRLSGKDTVIALGGAVVYKNGKSATSLPAGVTYAGEDADYVCFTVTAGGTYDFVMSENTAASTARTLTVNSIGNGTIMVNGAVVETPCTLTATASVKVTFVPDSGSRVAYLTGSVNEKLYSTDTVERTYTLGSDTTINAVFDSPLDRKPLLKIVDASVDPNTPSVIKEMFYAYRLYVNGEEVAMNQYFRDYMLPLPYMKTAAAGEAVTVSVKPVNAKNYEVYLDDGSGKLRDTVTLAMDGDRTIKITVVEKDTVKTYDIVKIDSNSILATSGSWNYTNGADGVRISDWHHNVNGANKDYKYLSSGYASKGYSSATPSNSSSKPFPITVTLDLGSVNTVNQVSLFPKNSYGAITGGAPCFPKDFTISVSADGNNYETVVTETDYENPGVHQQTFDFDEVDARYVKLTITRLGEPDYSLAESARYRVQLSEIEVAYVTTPDEPTIPDDPATPNDPTPPDNPTTPDEPNKETEPDTDTNEGEPSDTPTEPSKNHSECKGGFFKSIWTAIVNFFRQLFGKSKLCVCGEELT